MKLCKLLLGTYKRKVEHRVHVPMKRNVSGKEKTMVQPKKSTSVERVTRPSSTCSVHALNACLSDIGQIAWTKGSHPPKIYWLCNVRSR